MSERFELGSGNQITLSAGPGEGLRRLTRLSIDYPDVREVLLSPEEAERIGRALLARARPAAELPDGPTGGWEDGEIG